VILPLLNKDKNVLMVSHGNAIRALMKYIEKIPDEGVAKIEMLFGGIVIYDLDKDGCMISKEVRKVESEVHA
jgi:2,3-bisphosphoglycerate-dependent phosphoglycerate mutase